jgi:hypothetical protein
MNQAAQKNVLQKKLNLRGICKWMLGFCSNISF